MSFIGGSKPSAFIRLYEINSIKDDFRVESAVFCFTPLRLTPEITVI